MAQLHINTSSPNDGLGDTLRAAMIIAEANFTELYGNKVDKLTGWGLSQNNFSDFYKGILDTGFTQVQADWLEENPLSAAYIKNKLENVSDLFNDALYVVDVDEVGLFARSNGEWKSLEPKILDGFAGVTEGIAVDQVAFELPEGSKCLYVYLSHTKQYMTTDNNTSLVNRWSQTDNIVTLTKQPKLNNYLYIEYI